MNITLVAYKSNGSAVHMGCVTDTYGSDFKLETVPFDERSRVTDIVAELLDLNTKLDDQEPDWEINILIGGVPKDECLGSQVEQYDTSLGISMRALEAKQYTEKRLAEAEKERKTAEAAAKKKQQELETFFANAKTLGYSVTATAEAT